jgi:hypothetical protein
VNAAEIPLRLATVRMVITLILKYAMIVYAVFLALT